MRDLAKLVDEVRDNIQELKETRDRLSQLESSVVSGVNRLNTFIEEGGTTGDLILDLIILRHRSIDDELAGKYRTLENRLKGKVGQNILVINEEAYRYVYGATCNPNHYGLQKVTRSGKVNGEHFIFRGEEYFFPADGFFRYWKGDSAWINSPMSLISYSKSNLSNKEPMEPIVLIGDEEINDWLSLANRDEKIVNFVLISIKQLNQPSKKEVTSKEKGGRRKSRQKPFIAVKKIEK